MITTTELTQTISQANGETVRQTRSRIREAAASLDIKPAGEYGAGQHVEVVWHDDDADEIAMAITR